MNISVCFTTFNRTDLLYEAVAPFLHDDRIPEIVISDDCSNENILAEIREKYALTSKVRIFSNEVNLDCYFNKAKAIERATNEWVLILDSDNVFSKDFINRIENLWVAGMNDRTAYAPEFARPHFSFIPLAGKVLDHTNISVYLDHASTMLNAMNYLVNRNEYLRIFDRNTDPVTSDSIYQNFRWLEAGNNIYVVPELQYDHRVNAHGNQEPSHFAKHQRRTPRGFHETILAKLKSMR